LENDSETPMVVYEPHHFVYRYCEKHYGQAMFAWLHNKPKKGRVKFFRRRGKNEILLVKADDLRAYLDFIEDQFKFLLAPHSPIYWLHLYRRIKPALSSGHDSLTDEKTILLVRQIAELAIMKHADLGITDDLQSSKGISLEKIWGGYLLLAIKEIPLTVRGQWIKLFEESLASDASVPIKFRPADLRDLYGVEGWAYEYWSATARLRTIGKGANLYFIPQANLFQYDISDETSDLISRYDARTRSSRYLTTEIGLVVADTGSLSPKKLLALGYNVDKIDLTEFITDLGYRIGGAFNGPLTNFIPFTIDIAEFIGQHSYVDEEFAQKYGIDLASCIYTIWSIINLATIPNRVMMGSVELGETFLQLLKRGYVMYSTPSKALAVEARTRLEAGADLDQATLDKLDIGTIAKALDLIGLNKVTQNIISPWSGGPRPVIIPYGEATCIDVVGVAGILSRIFTGIRDDGQIRGTLFEETARKLVARVLNGAYEWGPRKIREGNGVKDEIDILLKDGDTVLVGECFTMWRPLIFEIGDRKTIENRTARIEEKIDQAMHTCKYLEANPVGKNYDYRDVTSFVPIVISPFIEWLPSTSARFWISKEVPRVMSLNEFVTFVESRKKSD
jgi:hypothetical protein